MRKLFVVLATLVAVCFLGVAQMQAASITVSIPDPTPFPYIGFGQGDASVTYSNVTFTQQAALGDALLFNVGSLFSGVPAVMSSQGAQNGVENILITLPWYTKSISLNYGTFGGSDVTFLLGNGFSYTWSSTGDGYNAGDWIGFGSSAAFDTLLVTSSDYVLNVNNITFDTPEPGTIAMLGSGLLVLGGAVRRKLML